MGSLFDRINYLSLMHGTFLLHINNFSSKFVSKQRDQGCLYSYFLLRNYWYYWYFDIEFFINYIFPSKIKKYVAHSAVSPIQLSFGILLVMSTPKFSFHRAFNCNHLQHIHTTLSWILCLLCQSDCSKVWWKKHLKRTIIV